MPDATEAEASVPVENEGNGGRISVRRKFANMLQYFNPFSTMPPQDEDVPAAKRPRLEEASTGTMSTAEDADTFVDAVQTTHVVTAASPDDTVGVAPTDAVTGAALLPSAGASRARAPPQIWTPEEDAKLTGAVKTLGKYWVAVAVLVPGRTTKQCRQRWAETLDPGMNSGRWTVEEDAMLIEAVTELGEDWVGVAVMVTGRTILQCRYRWVESLHPAIISGRWTADEDAILIEAVAELGVDWIGVSALVPSRTNIQCCYRWHKYLRKRTTVCAGNWTRKEDGASAGTSRACARVPPQIWKPEDDAKLTRAVKTLGKDWVADAAVVPNRTNIQCRSRWAETLDPGMNSGRWTSEEDAMLIEAVTEHGSRWAAVAAMVPGRTTTQCHSRWVPYLGPTIVGTINKGFWKSGEDTTLIDAVNTFGENWVRVAALVPGRTNIQCCGRWRKYLGKRTTGYAGKLTREEDGASSARNNWELEEDAKLMDGSPDDTLDVAPIGAVPCVVTSIMEGATRAREPPTSQRHAHHKPGPPPIGVNHPAHYEPDWHRFPGQPHGGVGPPVPYQPHWHRFSGPPHGGVSPPVPWNYWSGPPHGRVNPSALFQHQWHHNSGSPPYGRVIPATGWTGSHNPFSYPDYHSATGSPTVESAAPLKSRRGRRNVGMHPYTFPPVGVTYCATPAAHTAQRNAGRMSGTVRRKTAAMPAAAENLASPPSQNEDIPASKKTNTVVDAHPANTRTDSPFDTVDVALTDALAAAASLPSAGASRTRATQLKWNPEEDAKLLEAVEEFGQVWVAVAALFPGRTNTQCRQRWVNHLNPDINYGRWTLEEDEKLTDAVKKHGSSWVAVAAKIPRRRDTHCRRRWVNYLSSTPYRVWKPEEDAKLIEAVTTLGTDWVAVAAMVPSRTNLQCRQRWLHYLEQKTTARNEGTWTPEEDAMLTEAVWKHGINNWIAVAAMLPGRVTKQCRYRWVCLDPTLDRAQTCPWAAEEDAVLIEAVKKHGSRWVAVADALVRGRTNAQCHYRWFSYLSLQKTSARAG
jgi:hypothetical protein